MPCSIAQTRWLEPRHTPATCLQRRCATAHRRSATQKDQALPTVGSTVDLRINSPEDPLDAVSFRNPFTPEGPDSRVVFVNSRRSPVPGIVALNMTAGRQPSRTPSEYRESPSDSLVCRMRARSKAWHLRWPGEDSLQDCMRIETGGCGLTGCQPI